MLVVGLVYSLDLPNRLSGGQQVLDAARLAFTHQRVVGDVAAINMVDTVAKTFDPVVTQSGGAAAEVPKLVAFLAAKLHLTQPQVLAALKQNFPKILSLLTALPLSNVNAEIAGRPGKPGLVPFLASVLKVPPDAVVVALKQSFPHIYQVMANLPAVVNGWNKVPGTEKLTRFDGARVKTVPDVVAYFKGDVIRAVAAQQANLHSVDTTWPPLTVFPPLLLVIASIVIVFGLLMLILVPWLSKGQVRGRLVTAWPEVITGALFAGLRYDDAISPACWRDGVFLRQCLGIVE